jgi:GntR family transcriptional regulator
MAVDTSKASRPFFQKRTACFFMGHGRSLARGIRAMKENDRMQEQSFVDRDTAIPLYHQIYLQLRDEILSGQRFYGSAMPTEQEVSAMFDVSRITARRALTELAEQNFVARKRRLGTRVTFQSPAKPLEANIDQAVDSLLVFGRSTKVKVLEIVEEEAAPAIASAMKLQSGARIIRAVRLRFLEATPLGYIVSYVPADFAKTITRRNLEQKPILQLLDEAGCKAAQAQQTIGAMIADQGLSQMLEMESRAALLRISRTVFDAAERPFLLTFAHYRADRFNIRLDLQGVAIVT